MFSWPRHCSFMYFSYFKETKSKTFDLYFGSQRSRSLWKFVWLLNMTISYLYFSEIPFPIRSGENFFFREINSCLCTRTMFQQRFPGHSLCMISSTCNFAIEWKLFPAWTQIITRIQDQSFSLRGSCCKHYCVNCSFYSSCCESYKCPTLQLNLFKQHVSFVKSVQCPVSYNPHVP